jgi:hypothetical protein
MATAEDAKKVMDYRWEHTCLINHDGPQLESSTSAYRHFEIPETFPKGSHPVRDFTRRWCSDGYRRTAIFCLGACTGGFSRLMMYTLFVQAVRKVLCRLLKPRTVIESTVHNIQPILNTSLSFSQQRSWTQLFSRSSIVKKTLPTSREDLTYTLYAITNLWLYWGSRLNEPTCHNDTITQHSLLLHKLVQGCDCSYQMLTA